MTEFQDKVALIRAEIANHGLAGVRLRGSDWFAWATGGASSVVLLTAESGVAEVLVTARDAVVLTDEIEAARLADEELDAAFEVARSPWQEPRRREEFVKDHTRGGPVASDRPGAGESPLPPSLVAAKRRLSPPEVERYRALAGEAAAAMTRVLADARPEWTEYDLAGRAAQELWALGIHPALTMAAGASRVERYRHPVQTAAPLGDRAMLVFCARRHGLYANLTRWVYFRRPTAAEERQKHDVATVEAAAWAASKPGVALADVYARIVSAYAETSHAGEELRHHQGGTTGFLAREVVATPDTLTKLEAMTALAWNPSLPGAKIEDTVLCRGDAIDILTADPAWPTFDAGGRRRPDLLVRP